PVERAELAGDLLRQRLDRGGRAHVELERFCGLETLELGLVQVGRDHARALGGERLGDRAPNALARRGDECDLALQPSGHAASPCRNSFNGMRAHWFT